MIFSVQNSPFLNSIEIFPDVVQVQKREKVFGMFLARMDIPTKVWHMADVMQRDVNEHNMIQVPITGNPHGSMQTMEVSENMRMNSSEILDSRYVAQPVKFFLVPFAKTSARVT